MFYLDTGGVASFLPVLVSLVKRTPSERIGTNTNTNLPPVRINAYSSSSKYYMYCQSSHIHKMLMSILT